MEEVQYLTTKQIAESNCYPFTLGQIAVLVILVHRLHEVVSGELNDAISLDNLRAAFKGLDYYQTHALR